MATKICDRCKARYDEYGGAGSLSVLYFGTGRSVMLDSLHGDLTIYNLCPDCMEYIMYHLHNGSPQE